MKFSIIRLTFAFIMLFVIGGCAGVPVSQYGISVENVTAVRNSRLQPLAVSNFTSTTPGLSSIYCRNSLNIITPENSSYESYIQEAITDELKLAGLYDPASTVVLKGKIEKLDFSSIILAGKWIISMDVASERYSGFTTTITYNFSTNMMADIACIQVAEAFYPAVQKLIYQTVSDPRFKEL